MTDKLTVYSMNAQGLRNKTKRADVFDFLKNKKGQIYFLQDTHFIDEDMRQIYIEFGFEVYYNNGSSSSRGVAIFVDKKLDFQFKSKYCDCDGNMLIINGLICKKKLSLVTIYGPNQDKPEFFEEIKNQVKELEDPCIIAGDFNLVLNPELDYFDYLHINNPKARESLIETIFELDLVDCWRDINMEKKEFTWFKKNANKKARLDFFLISNSLIVEVTNCQILPGYRTDHSLIKLQLEFGKFKKGKSYWKMNNSLLKDINYVKKIKKKILDLKEQYCEKNLLNNRNISEIPNEEIKFNINDQLFFETILFEIRGETIAYSSKIKKYENEKEILLIKDISFLEKQLITNCTLLQEKRTELEKIREKKWKGQKLDRVQNG